MHLSCLALGLPAPPEVHAELEKRSALKTLSRTVKETLVAKQYLPLLREGPKSSWESSESISSWDEPLGFLERKRDVLLDKRSYSDSDLSKIAVTEVQSHIICPQLQKFPNVFCKIKLFVEAFITLLHSVSKDLEFYPYCTPALGNERNWSVQDLVRLDLRPVSPIISALSPGHNTTKKEPHPLDIPISSMGTGNNCAKRSKCTAKKALPKYSSSAEVTVILTICLLMVKKALVWML